LAEVVATIIEFGRLSIVSFQYKVREQNKVSNDAYKTLTGNYSDQPLLKDTILRHKI
jgi:hypothetical protein